MAKRLKDMQDPFSEPEKDARDEATYPQVTRAFFGDFTSAERSKAIKLVDHKTMQFDKFKMTPTGLIVQESVDEIEWLAMGGILRRMEASIQWLIGDWMNYGEKQWGKTYAEVSELTGYEEASLYQYAWVARSIQFSMRIEKLSYTHHTLVASLKLPNKEPNVEAQKKWLQRAVENGWSVSVMRKEILGVKPEKSEDIFADLLVQLEIRIERHVDKAVKEGKKEEVRELITELRSWVDGLERRLPPR